LDLIRRPQKKYVYTCTYISTAGGRTELPFFPESLPPLLHINLGARRDIQSEGHRENGESAMGKLAGQVAVVTGASKGIGAGIAKALGAEGASVVVNYSSSREGADRVVQQAGEPLRNTPQSTQRDA
jgi:hypothetical protein